MVTLDAPAPVSALAAVSSPGQRPMLATGSGTGVQLWDVQIRDVVHTLLTAAPGTGLTHRHVGDDHRLWITGPAGVAAFTISLPSA
jgi:hypothetical protein